MIALLLAACAPAPVNTCTRFADIAVTNPDGGAAPDALAEVRAAIDEFAGWSAQEGLCVDEVRLVAEVTDREERVAGSYQGRRIEIDEAARGPSAVVTHALCHAADNQAAWFSDTRPDWFARTTRTRSSRRPAPRGRAPSRCWRLPKRRAARNSARPASGGSTPRCSAPPRSAGRPRPARARWRSTGALETGAVFDGAAWVVGTAAGEAERTLSRVDLGTGARTAVAWPDGVETWSPLPDGDALAGWAWHADDERVWLRYAPDTGVWTRPARPDAWEGGEIVTLPDGRLLATWLDDVGVSEEGGLAVSDASGAWWLPEAPCGEDAVGLPRELLSVGGEPWLWEYRGGWYGSEVSGGEGDALTRVEVSR